MTIDLEPHSEMHGGTEGHHESPEKVDARQRLGVWLFIGADVVNVGRTAVHLSLLAWCEHRWSLDELGGLQGQSAHLRYMVERGKTEALKAPDDDLLPR